MKGKYFLKRLVRPVYIAWKRRGNKEVLVLGDSHVNVFDCATFKKVFPDCFFNVVAVGGATVSGLQNPKSKTQAMPIFLKNIKKTKAKHIIVQLGEVDTGFVIWHRAEKYGVPVDEMLYQAVNNYQGLLKKLYAKAKVICISAPLPTIKDNQDRGEVANLRKSIKATQKERTELTVRFNHLIQSFCEKEKIIYLSFDRESLGPDGVVSSKLLNSNSDDHHYERWQYAEMITGKLKEVLD